MGCGFGRNFARTIGIVGDRGFHGEPERALTLALACWLIGVIVGLRGLRGPRERGTSRTLAWVGVLMNIWMPLIGWMLAPLLVGLMMSAS